MEISIDVGGGGTGETRPAPEMDWNSMDMWTTSPFVIGIVELPSSNAVAPKVYRDYEIVNMMITGSAKNRKTPRLVDENNDPYCNDDFITKMIEGSKNFPKNVLIKSGKTTSC